MASPDNVTLTHSRSDYFTPPDQERVTFTDSIEVGRLLMSQTFDYSRDIGRIWRP